ncbi:MAG: dodecin family protein [Anaerolineae bacterium]
MGSIAKVIEVLAQSEEGWEDAAQIAVTEASKTVRNVRHLYVKELQADVEDGKIVNYRLNAKITFVVEE